MTRARPPTALGTSRVNAHGPRAARSRTASSRAGVAAVLWATIRTRVGSAMRGSFSGDLGLQGSEQQIVEIAVGLERDLLGMAVALGGEPEVERDHGARQIARGDGRLTPGLGAG